VTLYTKDDCGLCRQAEQLLLRLQKRFRFEVEFVDIEADPGVFGRYWARVPVVAVDGKEVAAAPLDERRLKAALAS
jgi:glutaredoxin